MFKIFVFVELFQEILIFTVNTQRDLTGLLKMLIGEDGAQLLAMEFRIKIRNNVVDIREKV